MAQHPFCLCLLGQRCFVNCTTVKPVLKDHPIGHKITVVSQHRWPLVTGSVILKCRSCQDCMVFQDRWSLIAVVFHDRFHCNNIPDLTRTSSGSHSLGDLLNCSQVPCKGLIAKHYFSCVNYCCLFDI